MLTFLKCLFSGLLEQVYNPASAHHEKHSHTQINTLTLYCSSWLDFPCSSLAFFLYSGFLPQSKHMFVRCVHGWFGVFVVNRWPVQDVPLLLPWHKAPAPTWPSCPHITLTRVRGKISGIAAKHSLEFQLQLFSSQFREAPLSNP